MPNRLIRDDMLESERVLSLTVEARWLYVTILLSADDVGLFEATEFKLARKADLRREHLPRLLEMIAEADLVRLYECGGRTYGFIPRFRQRIQIKRTKHPLPPQALMRDDEDAIKKINNLGSDTTDVQRLDNGCPSDAQPSEPEPEPEEKKKHISSPSGPMPGYRPPPCPFDELLSLYHSKLPSLPRVEVMNDARKRHMAARWRDVCTDGKCTRQQALDWFAWYFGHVATSGFLLGQIPGKSGRAWRADIDFLINPQKFVRVIEGAYHKEAV